MEKHCFELSGQLSAAGLMKLHYGNSRPADCWVAHHICLYETFRWGDDYFGWGTEEELWLWSVWDPAALEPTYVGLSESNPYDAILDAVGDAPIAIARPTNLQEASLIETALFGRTWNDKKLQRLVQRLADARAENAAKPIS